MVRILSPVLGETLEEIYRLSPAARVIIDELERSDLIVHVQPMPLHLRRQFNGMMRFVLAAGNRRFLRLTINEQLPADRRAAALAHELQHALEVARADGVDNAAAFAALYRSIGRESGGDRAGSCFETDAAQRVGAEVLNDYRAAAAASRRSRTAAANSSH